MELIRFIAISIVVNVILTFALVSPFSLVSNLGGYFLGTGSSLLPTPLIFLMYLGEVVVTGVLAYVYWRQRVPEDARPRTRRFVVVFVVTGFCLVIPLFIIAMFIPVWPS